MTWWWQLKHTETATLHVASPHTSRELTAQNIPPTLLLCKTCLCYKPDAQNRKKTGMGPAWGWSGSTSTLTGHTSTLLKGTATFCRAMSGWGSWKQQAVGQMLVRSTVYACPGLTASPTCRQRCDHVVSVQVLLHTYRGCHKNISCNPVKRVCNTSFTCMC